MDKYIDFLLKAKKNTYANNSGQILSSRPSSYDQWYEEGDLTYIDSYLGTHLFTGEEAIWEANNPVWAMNYTGRVLSDNFSSKVFKRALMHPTAEYPYRGQPIYREEDYTYVMDVQGEFDWFAGKESMYYKEELVYELLFHGGKVIDKHFD
ncbi:MAG: DUF5680 domain-containing protein [Streptococcaceae bacterium]|jgi:hypothetical protein|nr:DUF5680 domain-containing protein [Streptococcaceae bacterium]